MKGEGRVARLPQGKENCCARPPTDEMDGLEVQLFF